MKKEYKIFFAIPFDVLTKKIYEEIRDIDLKKYSEDNKCQLTVKIGNKQVSSSPEYDDIATFKLQNSDLHKQIFKDIAESDIIIADLTNNNPNVHLELGIALTLNKNILRVTGKPTTELPFDSRNLEVNQYSGKDDLFKKIEKYLDTFLKIKKLDFSSEFINLYRKIPGPILLPGTEKEIKKDSFWLITSPINKDLLKDGALRLKIKFTNNLDDNSWVGVYFRAAREFILDSHLIYIRKNGFIELGTYPGPIIEFRKKGPRIATNVELELQVEIENYSLEVKIGNDVYNDFPPLRIQGLGNILIATWECRAEFKDIELINRDTIELVRY